MNTNVWTQLHSLIVYRIFSRKSDDSIQEELKNYYSHMFWIHTHYIRSHLGSKRSERREREGEEDQSRKRTENA